MSLFLEQEKSLETNLVFMPYNYIFVPVIKKKMNINLQNSIIMIDEGNNIQGICIQIYSKDLDTNLIEQNKKELKDFEKYFKKIICLMILIPEKNKKI